ncbi:hypothetical protein ABT075_17105 [Streptomyces sp. NPDC002677]|uniref:hypothetical protein n=1 Tax=Streptomyces sp. NPDC002677 TaxID=3154774 RepID=UPI003318F876
MNISVTDRPRVFLGAPSILTPQQQPDLERWVAWLEHRSCEVVRVTRDSYGADPWRLLTGLFSHSDGVLLLGFRQLDARSAVWRPDTKEEARSPDWWTSPWLQLEAGMAVALRVPVLVAPETEVEDGVFHPDVWGTHVQGTALTDPGATADRWLTAVREHRDRRTSAGPG